MARRAFLHELKRRNVWRAVALYIGAVWALAQGVSQLAPALGLPDWTTRAFLIACAIGFPFWAAFAWFYELTPEGFKRENEIAHDASARLANARKLDFAIIGVLIVAVALLATGYFFRGNSPAARKVAFEPPADSIVVLPFTNLSDDPKQVYFSNGITEELTGALGQNTGLTVIAWDTASRLAGSKQTPAEIGKALNVAHILAGSIQREGDKVRVSVELVSTVTGRQLWAAHYDDSLKNIFAVQDRITGAIADTLKVKFAGMQAAPTLSPQAHELYLKGLAALDKQTGADAQAAQQHFQQAVALDPNYADAWAALGTAYVQLMEYSTLPSTVAAKKIRAAAEKAMALAPHNANALVALGIADYLDGNTAQAHKDFQRALALDPNNVKAHLDYGVTLPLREKLAQTLEAARLDPDNVTAQSNLGSVYSDLGDWPRAAAAAKAMIRLSPHNTLAAFNLAGVYAEMGHNDDAAKAFDLVQPKTDLDRQLLAAGKLTYQAVLNPKLKTEALAALGRLQGAAMSPNEESDVIGLYETLGYNETVLTMLPHMCAASPALCTDLAADKQLSSLHDPRFEKLVKKYGTYDSAPASAPPSVPASASSR